MEYTFQEEAPEKSGYYWVEIDEDKVTVDHPLQLVLFDLDSETFHVMGDYYSHPSEAALRWALPRIAEPELPPRRPSNGWYSFYWLPTESWYSVKVEENTQGFDLHDAGWVGILDINWRDSARVYSLPDSFDDDEEQDDDDDADTTDEDDDSFDDDDSDGDDSDEDDEY